QEAHKMALGASRRGANFKLRHALAAATLGGALAAACPVVASAATPTHQYVLNSYTATDKHASHVVNGPERARRLLYTIDVKGTLSYYAPGVGTHPASLSPFKWICGTPEKRPMFRSPHRINGQVGMDAETIFARPCGGTQDARSPDTGHWNNFQIKTYRYFR